MDFASRYGPWAIIAGASEGIGRSFARSIARRGVSCILVALDGPLDEVAEEVRACGVEALTARIDLAAPDAFERIAEAAEDKEVGLYVANAGGDANASRYLDIEAEAWLRLARVNIMTTMQACHHFGGQMRERKRGGLLIVNSGGCYGGGGFLVTYNAAKAFLLNFAEGLWSELRKHGVDVLTIALNVTDTPNLRRILAKTGAALPEGAASPDEVAEVALAQLANGPVQNWGLAEDEPGFAGFSAAERRARVLAMDEGGSMLYEKLTEQD
jgi:short-subunit dehydrogenase